MHDFTSDYEIPTHIATKIEDLSDIVRLSMGETLVNNSPVVDSFYFLLEGRLRQTVNFPFASAQRFTLSTYNAPYIAGISSFFNSSPLPNITASEDSSLLKIDRDSLLSLLSTFQI